MDDLVKGLEKYGLKIKVNGGVKPEEAIKNLISRTKGNKVTFSDLYSCNIKIDEHNNEKVKDILELRGQYKEISDVLFEQVEIVLWEEVPVIAKRGSIITAEFGIEDDAKINYVLKKDLLENLEKYKLNNQKNKMIGMFAPEKVEKVIMETQYKLFFEYMDSAEVKEKENEISDELSYLFSNPGKKTDLLLKRLKENAK